MDVLFKMHEGIPRQGPGNSESTKKALSMLPDLPPKPEILDVGCGTGAQTMDLARATGGRVTAVDVHQPFLDEVERRARLLELAERVRALNMSMLNLTFPPASFDLIWSEGAIYIMGFGNGLKAWRPLLRRRGHVVVSELSWLQSPSDEPKRFWAANYPGMKDIQGNLEVIRDCDYKPVGTFVLPEEGWLQDYYAPLQANIDRLRQDYAHDSEALRQMDEAEREMDLYRKYSSAYAYVFYLMQVA